MGWIHIDTNTVSAIGRLIFRKRERFEDFWTLSFTNRSDVMSAYAENVTAANQPIVFTNKTNSANVGNIKVHIFEETTFGTTPVGDNFNWSSSGTNVNVAANGTYSYQGITHTSIADEFYYDGTSHGVSPYSGTLDGAHSYRIQFIYTDTATGKEYLSDWYDFGSHYYYNPMTDFTQWARGDVDLVYTINVPSKDYELGETVTGTIQGTNTYPYPCTFGFIAPDGVTLSKSTFENVAAGSTATATFEYTITEDDIIRGYKTFDFGGTAPGGFMNPIDIKGKTVSCTVQTDVANPYLDIVVSDTSVQPHDPYALGDRIEIATTVTNNGNLTLYNITVDSELIEATETFSSLSPGESQTFVWNYYVAETDIWAQEITFYVTANYEDSTGSSWTSEGECSCAVEAINAEVSIDFTETSTPPENGYDLGDTIEYEIHIENAGNVNFSTVAWDNIITCELTGDQWTFSGDDINMYPGGNGLTFTCSYWVTEEDILAGSVICTVDILVHTPDDQEYSFDSSPIENQTADPRIGVTASIEMNDDLSTYYEGDYINNSCVFTNTGNISLMNCIFYGNDNGTKNSWSVDGDFKPGEVSKKYTDEWYVNSNGILSWEVFGDTADENNPEYSKTYTITLPVESAPSNPHSLAVKCYEEQLDGSYQYLAPVYSRYFSLNHGDTYKITPLKHFGFTSNPSVVQGTLNDDTVVNVYYNRNSYPLKIYYTYQKDNTTACQTYEQNYLYNAQYNVESPIIPGYLPDKDIVKGTMGASQHVERIKYYFSNQYYRLIVHYHRLELDGSYTSFTSGTYAPVTKFIEHGGTYNIKSPSMTNYTPDLAVVSGTLNEDKEINVYYNRPRHQLIIHYYMQQSDGTYVLDDSKTSSQWYWEGSSYSKTTESITGYTADTARVTGTMGNQDTVVDVHYDLITYSFTVHYRKIDGPSAHPDITVTGTVLDSDKYIISPAVEGYQAGNKYIKWHPGSNVSSVIVTYTTITSGSWVEITDGNYVTTSVPYAFTVSTTIDGDSSFVDDQDTVVFLQPFTIYVWTGCNVTVHWEGSSYVPSTWNGYIQEVSWNNGSGTQTKTYDNATDSFTITSNNNIFASTNFTERQ